jgi:hypothetical protein
MQLSTHLVIARNAKGKAIARRVVRSYPALAWDEAVVKLTLDIPDDAFDAPLVTVPVTKTQIAVAAEAEEASLDARLKENP